MSDVASSIVDVGLKKNTVARRFVQLDVVFRGEKILELRAIESGRTTNERQSRHVEGKFILPERLHRTGPVRTRGQVIHETAVAELRGNHFICTKNSEIFGDQWMRVDLPSQIQGQLNRPVDQFISFQLHLAPRYI